MNLSPEIKAQILAHASAEAPKESCGLLCIVKGKERYFACKNLADTPDEHFVLDPLDYAKAEEQGEITAVIHSHPGMDPAPSEADRVSCNKTGLPWHIVNPYVDLWGYCEPSDYELPYVGRVFVHGVVDCYSLVRDWYRKERGLLLRDYDRRDMWWHKGENLYVENFKKEGFKPIRMDELREGDALLMNLVSPVPNHAAIYLGDQMVLHHVQQRLSSRDILGGYYLKQVAHALRYEGN